QREIEHISHSARERIILLAYRVPTWQPDECFALRLNQTMAVPFCNVLSMEKIYPNLKYSGFSMRIHRSLNLLSSPVILTLAHMGSAIALRQSASYHPVVFGARVPLPSACTAQFGQPQCNIRCLH